MMRQTDECGDFDEDCTSNSTRRSKRLRPEDNKVKEEQDKLAPLPLGQKKKKKKKEKNEYCGYKLTNDSNRSNVVDTLTDEISPTVFFDRYISKRKPVILNSFPSFPRDEITVTRTKAGTTRNEPSSLQWKVNESILQSVAGDEIVQVEKRRHSKESFGQPRTESRQIHMKLNDFLECLHKNENDADTNPELYYLSLQQQQEQQPVEDDEADSSTIYQTPCLQLVQNRYIPSTLPIAGNMVLHSCNLWMGTSIQGSSSGLHHDYHDNFYILLNGTKRFKLYSPDSALHMHTKGNIHKVYPNGLISYVGSETRSDGVPLSLLPTFLKAYANNHNQFTDANNEEEMDQNNSLADDCNDRLSEEEEEDEEEIVIGGGFDYKSSDEGEEDKQVPCNWDNDDHDDYDDIAVSEHQVHNDSSPAADNFSTIPASVFNDKDKLIKDFPDVATLPSCDIQLQSGQCLYLPAGWFHEVVSFSSSSDRGSNSAHIAVNYWFFPPNSLTSFDSPYEDDLLKKTMEKGN